MKKIAITMALTVSLFSSSFAGDEKIKNKIIKAFTSQFANANEVTWAKGVNYARASFEQNGKWMYAYYSNSGQLLGVKQNIPPTQLPYYLQNSRNAKYGEYWITGLFELSNKHGYTYFMTIQNADNTIILKSVNGSDWNQHQ